MGIQNETLEAAATWWASQLVTDTQWENAADEIAKLLPMIETLQERKQFISVTSMASFHKIPPDKISKFRENLLQNLKNHPDIWSKDIKLVC